MKIVIPGAPVALKRHRHTLSGKNYNSQRDLMNEVSFIAKSQWKYPPYSIPLKVVFSFFMPIPKRYIKKYPGLPCPTRPDLSNILKFYEDSLIGVLWTDDSIITQISTAKLYSLEPRTEIEIYPF